VQARGEGRLSEPKGRALGQRLVYGPPPPQAEAVAKAHVCGLDLRPAALQHAVDLLHVLKPHAFSHLCVGLIGIEEQRREEHPLSTRLGGHYAAVLHLYRQPPRVASEEVERYVQALFETVSRTSVMAFKYEFTLETPLTIYAKWPCFSLEMGLAWHPILNAVSPLCGIKPEDLFRTAEEEGDLIFTDAYPTRWERLVEPDVITPHYREAAGEISEAQARPVPLVFPVVPAGTTFTFVVAFRQKVGQECWGETLRWLQQVLTRGLGAKTQLSYGVFRRQT